MPRIKSIRQHDDSDCGAACLAAIASYYGLHLSLAQIREYASIGRSGTNVLGLTRAAEKLGMTAKGVKGPFEAIVNAPFPCIAHLITNNRNHHFVVLVRAGRKKIRYMDPAAGKMISVSCREFRQVWTGVLVFFSPGSCFKRENNRISPSRRFIQLIRPFRKVMLQSLTGAMMYSLLGLSTAVYVQKIIDYVLVKENLSLLNLMSLSMILLLILRSLTGYMKNLFLLKTGHQIDSGLLMGYYRHLINLPQRFFDSMKTGEILSRMGDAIKIRHFINHSAIELAVSISSISLTLLAMFVISRKLCLLVSLAIPVYALIFYIYDRFNRNVLRKTMEKAAELESHMVETISLSRFVKEFGLHAHCTERTEKPFIGFLKSSYLAGRAAIRSNQATELLSGLLTVSLLWIGARRVCHQYLTPGELMSFYAMLGYLLGPVATLTGSSRSIRDAGIAADRLFQILDAEREKNTDRGLRIRHFSRGLEFRHVSFRYGSGPLLFRDLSFHIACGSYTGIAGRNGCGKSSLASLLLALYPAERGKILLDGHETGQLYLPDLRDIITIVPQQIELFSGSLLENIAPGESDPDLHKILDLAGRTGLDRLLENLPGGILTPIGERGFGLSGGERQRMAIIRALYRDPAVLILDEATSALDPNSEALIHSLLESYIKMGTTLIQISHKLQSLIRADKILFLDEGRVAEQGSHSGLLMRRGKYYRYWNTQNGLEM